MGRAWSQKELDDLVERVGGQGGGTCKDQLMLGLMKGFCLDSQGMVKTWRQKQLCDENI